VAGVRYGAVKEAGIEKVKNSVLDAADILIDREPILCGVRVDRRLRLRIGETGEVPRARFWLWSGSTWKILAFPGAPEFADGTRDEYRPRVAAGEELRQVAKRFYVREAWRLLLSFVTFGAAWQLKG